MALTKEEAVKRIKILLQHKKEMEKGAKKYYDMDLKTVFG